MNCVTTLALTVLLAVWLSLLAFGSVRAAWRRLGRQRFFAILAASAVATIIAQKLSTITFDELLVDAGSYATNDVLHVAAEKAPAAAFIDLDSAPLLVYRREMDSTNAADWVECLPRRTFGDLPADWNVPDATNYNYMIYVDYVPPSPVHTNGVWEMRGFALPGHSDTYAFPNTRQETIR